MCAFYRVVQDIDVPTSTSAAPSNVIDPSRINASQDTTSLKQFTEVCLDLDKKLRLNVVLRQIGSAIPLLLAISPLLFCVLDNPENALVNLVALCITFPALLSDAPRFYGGRWSAIKSMFTPLRLLALCVCVRTILSVQEGLQGRSTGLIEIVCAVVTFVGLDLPNMVETDLFTDWRIPCVRPAKPADSSVVLWKPQTWTVAASTVYGIRDVACLYTAIYVLGRLALIVVPELSLPLNLLLGVPLSPSLARSLTIAGSSLHRLWLAMSDYRAVEHSVDPGRFSCFGLLAGIMAVLLTRLLLKALVVGSRYVTSARHLKDVSEILVALSAPSLRTQVIGMIHAFHSVSIPTPPAVKPMSYIRMPSKPQLVPSLRNTSAVASEMDFFKENDSVTIFPSDVYYVPSKPSVSGVHAHEDLHESLLNHGLRCLAVVLSQTVYWNPLASWFIWLQSPHLFWNYYPAKFSWQQQLYIAGQKLPTFFSAMNPQKRLLSYEASEIVYEKHFLMGDALVNRCMSTMQGLDYGLKALSAVFRNAPKRAALVVNSNTDLVLTCSFDAHLRELIKYLLMTLCGQQHYTLSPLYAQIKEFAIDDFMAPPTITPEERFRLIDWLEETILGAFLVLVPGLETMKQAQAIRSQLPDPPCSLIDGALMSMIERLIESLEDILLMPNSPPYTVKASRFVEPLQIYHTWLKEFHLQKV